MQAFSRRGLLSQGATFSRGGLLALGTGVGWFNAPEFADLAAIADFNRDRYAITTVPLANIPIASVAELCVKRACSFAEWFAFVASSTTARSYTDVNGILRNDLAAGQPRFDWINGRRQLGLNAAVTNVIRNNTTQGALTGSPGTGPTNWSIGVPTGCAREITNVGTFNGVEVIDLRVTGTASGGALVIRPDSSLTQAAASAGQSWTFSSFFHVMSDVGGALTDLRLSILALDSGPVQIGAADGPNLITAAQAWSRLQNTYSTTPASTASVLSGFSSGTTNWAGKTVDLTIRIGLPQLEQNPLASPVVKTYGSQVTRAIETAELSPTLEAILQRSAASVVVRGQNLLRAQGMMIGLNGGTAFLRSATGRTTAVIDGSSSLVSGGGLSFETNSWAAASAFDAAGRSVVRNGGTVTTDTGTPPATRTAGYLARNGSATLYGDGWYDFVGIAPSRLSDARLTALAVPA